MKTYDRPWTSIVLTQPVAYFYKLRSQLGVKYFNKLLKFRTIYRLQPVHCSWIMYNITFLSGEGWIISRLSSQKFSPYLPWEATKNGFDIQFRSDFITPAQTGLTAEKWYRWILVRAVARHKIQGGCTMASQTSRDDQWPGHGTRCGSLPSDNR